MNIELKPINENTRNDCIKLKVTEAQSAYIATNETSLETALENVDVARPFVIYADGKAAGLLCLRLMKSMKIPTTDIGCGDL